MECSLEDVAEGQHLKLAAQCSDASKPRVDFGPYLVLGVAVVLLQAAFQLVAASFDDIKIVIGEFAPLLLGLAFDFFPVSFNAIPVHDVLLYISRIKQRCSTLTVNVEGGFRFR